MTAINSFFISGISTMQLSIVLIITTIVFMFFIVIAIIKMQKLKAENKKLLESDGQKIRNRRKTL